MPGSRPAGDQEAYLHPEFNIFDRNPDPALDELAELAAVLCGADYAYIGWMDFNRLWFKARYGFKGVEQAKATTTQAIATTTLAAAVKEGQDNGREVLMAVRLLADRIDRQHNYLVRIDERVSQELLRRTA